MLEIALKQERIKYHKLKFGADLPLFNNTQNETKNNTSLSNDNGNYLFIIWLYFLD